MNKLLRTFATTVALFFSVSAHAQWQVPDHSVPIGRGGGAQGFKNAAPSATALPLVSAGMNADPLFQLLGYAGGGTNASTQVGARNNIFPTPTRAGDIVYWNGTVWVTLVGNNSGSVCFGENASGVPSWVTCGGAAAGTNGQIQYNNGGALAGFTMSGDATTNTATGALTLATVNANVGSFGSATQCTAFTTNAKGLITAASQVTCTPAVASITGLGTGVGAVLAVNVGTAGSVVVNGGVLGTPSSGVATNLTGIAAGLTAGNVTTNANLTGVVTSIGNATSLGAGAVTSANLRSWITDETGTGLAYFQGGDIGTPTAGVGSNLTALNASNLSSGTTAVARGGTGQNTLTANAFLTGNGTTAINQVAITGLVLGNGASAPTAYGGTSACTNQFMTALSALGVATCTSPVLASAQFANQGSTTTVLHGNAAGNPSFAAVSLTADVTGVLPFANGGTNDANTSATPYTPTVVCDGTAGTPTLTAAGKYKQMMGKLLWVAVDINITALGGCTGNLYATFPTFTPEATGNTAMAAINQTTNVTTPSIVLASTPRVYFLFAVAPTASRFEASGIIPIQ